MRLYQFVLPLKSNDGKHSYASELSRWEDDALTLAGGYTDMGSTVGYWVDPAGKTVGEVNKVYQVATERDGADLLTEAAFKLFYDQDAIFRADLGEGHIIARPKIALAA